MREIIIARNLSVKRADRPDDEILSKKRQKTAQILLIFHAPPAILSKHFARKRIFLPRGRAFRLGRKRKLPEE